MDSICKDIFRSIHEGCWIYIEYKNKSEECTKYWIAVRNINLEKKSLEATGLHLGDFTTKNLFLFIEKILRTRIIEGTYFKTNKDLIENIDLYPQKYKEIFSEIVNLKTLNYLSDCNKLADIPKLNTKYELINRLDSSKLKNRIYNLDDEQFKMFVNSFKKSAETKEEKNINSTIQIALNELSIHTQKGLYVLAYREVRFDVERQILIAGNKIKICSEFCMEKSADKNSKKLSILNFIDNEDLSLLENFEENAETIKDIVMQNIKNKKDCAVDDRPYFLCLQRDLNIDLEKEYESIINMYSQNNVTVPIQAFFGELRSIKQNDKVYPLALINKNVNLDQLLAIHTAMNFPVAYIQGPPGTGKTTTIISTIITAFFNSKTVLFSSYNNHPIDGVFEKLTNLKYKNYRIPFPILRIGSNDRIQETCLYIKNLLSQIKSLKSFDTVLQQNKESQIERTKKLTELLQKHEEQLDLAERKELIEEMLSKSENMNLRMNLEGQQYSKIKKRLEEIGNISDEDALSLLDFDHEKLMQFINFTLSLIHI